VGGDARRDGLQRRLLPGGVARDALDGAACPQPCGEVRAARDRGPDPDLVDVPDPAAGALDRLDADAGVAVLEDDDVVGWTFDPRAG
jgi:hypothetical protein